jgi:DNA modification methylase
MPRIARAHPRQGQLEALADQPAPLATGVLYREDNLVQLGEFPDACVDLIYLDPPFFSNRVYEVIWGDEAEVRSFEDRWAGGIQNYIDWMEERASELHRVLKPTGSLFLHCDPHASHYLKVMLDRVFGMSKFRNDIIWKRTNAHSSAKKFAPVHDTILYYAKGNNPVWNSPRTEYTDEYLDKYYRFDDGDGRLYWRADLTASGVRNGESGKPWRGFDPGLKGRHWKFAASALDELDRQGRIYFATGGQGWPQYKRYRDELKGKSVADIWDDIDRINPVGSERLGYPTQKPIALLQRIIEVASNEGDIVLDPFCGCGTTIEAAERLRRRWIGIDISATAMEVMRRRLLKIGCQPAIEKQPDTIESLKELRPFEFQNWIITQVNGTQSPRKVGDMGIDGFWFFTREPIQVKQSEHVGRNVVDNFETALRRANEKAGYIIAFSFTKGAVEEVARAKQDGLDIRLIKVAEVLLRTKRASNFSRKFGPQPDENNLPLPEPRKASEMRSAAELLESERERRAG